MKNIKIINDKIKVIKNLGISKYEFNTAMDMLYDGCDSLLVGLIQLYQYNENAKEMTINERFAEILKLKSKIFTAKGSKFFYELEGEDEINVRTYNAILTTAYSFDVFYQFDDAELEFFNSVEDAKRICKIRE